jgi:hypothetical protein
MALMRAVVHLLSRKCHIKTSLSSVLSPATENQVEGAMELESWQSLPLESVLREAGDLLSHEDTRLPAAFALLYRLKVK